MLDYLDNILDDTYVTFGVICLLSAGLAYFCRLIYKHRKMNE